MDSSEISDSESKDIISDSDESVEDIIVDSDTTAVHVWAIGDQFWRIASNSVMLTSHFGGLPFANIFYEKKKSL